MTNFAEFIRDDAGAVTIDWVALTAGILLLGIAVVYGIFNTGVGSLATSVNESLSTGIPTVELGETPGQETFNQGG